MGRTLTGHELGMGRFTPIAKETRFWEKVKRADGCWEWQGKRQNGYGVLATGPQGRQIRELAHRLSWQFNRGPIPDGLLVLHHCDNRPCVRPDHLHLGTYADNNREAAERGRTLRGDARRERQRGRMASGDRHASRLHPEILKRGEVHPHAKLTWAAVAAIRERYAAGGISQRALAASYGVSQGTLWALLRGRGWVQR